MGLLKFCASMFSCKSSCKFNEQYYDDNINRMSLSDFELKHKDIQTIHRILSKRKRQVEKQINKLENRKIEVEI